MENQKSEKKLKGVIPAVITPFDRYGKIDEGMFQKQIEYLSTRRVNGFFVNGTTGEGVVMSDEEKQRLIELTKNFMDKNQFLCAACLKPSTSQTIGEIKSLQNLAPDFIAAVTPFYYPADQKTIVKHFQEIAKNSPFPVVIYNIPQCTHNPMSTDTIFRLAEVQNIVGIKDSGGDFTFFLKCMEGDLPEHFSLIQGYDNLYAPSLLLGADGLVTGLGNIWIEPYVSIYKEAKKGNIRRVKELQKEIDKLSTIIDKTENKTIQAIKAGTFIMERSEKWMKDSYLSLSNDETEKIKNVLRELGIL